jgi:hypothetical protein
VLILTGSAPINRDGSACLLPYGTELPIRCKVAAEVHVSAIPAALRGMLELAFVSACFGPSVLMPWLHLKALPPVHALYRSYALFRYHCPTQFKPVLDRKLTGRDRIVSYHRHAASRTRGILAA